MDEMILEEIWKDIPGFEGRYQASSLGRIKSINPSGRGHDVIMSSRSKTFQGYNIVNLRKNGKRKSFLVHRLIASTFIENPNSFPLVNHKNEEKADNRVDNLEWCDHHYNASYGSIKSRQTKKLGKKVFCVEPGSVFNSLGEAQRIMGIPYQNISRCCHHRCKTAGGYHWRFI